MVRVVLPDGTVYHDAPYTKEEEDDFYRRVAHGPVAILSPRPRPRPSPQPAEAEPKPAESPPASEPPQADQPSRDPDR